MPFCPICTFFERIYHIISFFSDLKMKLVPENLKLQLYNKKIVCYNINVIMIIGGIKQWQK